MELGKGAVIGDTALGPLPCRKASEIVQISRGTHHDDQNQGCARGDARRLCCAGCHGAPAYSPRAHPPLDPCVWVRQCLPVWQRLPMVSSSRIRGHSPGLHSRLGLRNRRRPRPIPSMRDGGQLARNRIEINSPPSRGMIVLHDSRVMVPRQRCHQRGRAPGSIFRHCSRASIGVCHPGFSPGAAWPSPSDGLSVRGRQAALQRC
jgi:hypothetical protein